MCTYVSVSVGVWAFLLPAFRLCSDVTEVFKITHNIHDTTVSPDLSLNERANTRGHNYELQNHSFHYDLRKHFFSAHIHTFNGPFSGTTGVSRYQKGKTNLDFIEARAGRMAFGRIFSLHAL